MQKIPVILLFGMFLANSPVWADASQIVAQARAAIGPEASLNAVQTLSYAGTLTSATNPEEKVAVSLYLRKPNSQRLEVEGSSGRQTILVNGEEGFAIFFNKETQESVVQVLPFAQSRLYRANARENLFFFRFPPEMRAEVKFLGNSEFMGKPSREMRFTHPGNVIFFRHFDPENGRLLGTVTEDGIVNVEDGDLQVGDLRFRREVRQYRNGEHFQTITFDRIEVNPDLDDSLFAAPF